MIFHFPWFGVLGGKSRGVLDLGKAINYQNTSTIGLVGVQTCRVIGKLYSLQTIVFMVKFGLILKLN